MNRGKALRSKTAASLATIDEEARNLTARSLPANHRITLSLVVPLRL